MSRYDGLIIPRSYSEYINKTDAATLQQALQLSGVMDNAPTADSVHPVKSGGIYAAIEAKSPVDTVALNNMKSITSNAVAQRIDVYNTDAQYILTSVIQNEIRNAFNNTANYNPFSGYTMNSNEGYYQGFRNRETGVGLLYTRTWIIGFYLDADSFRSKYIMQLNL